MEPAANTLDALIARLDALKPGERADASGVGWDAYLRLDDHREATFRRGVRMAFDRGRLEMFCTTYWHERVREQFRSIVSALAAGQRRNFSSVGGTTLLRSDLQRCIDPDISCYVANAPLIRGIMDLDLHTLPPPELAVEINIPPARIRLRTFAALGLPEVWWFHNDVVTMLALGPDGYSPAPGSLSFPGATADGLTRLLAAGADDCDNEFMDRSRQWVRTLSQQP